MVNLNRTNNHLNVVFIFNFLEYFPLRNHCTLISCQLRVNQIFHLQVFLIQTLHF